MQARWWTVRSWMVMVGLLAACTSVVAEDKVLTIGSDAPPLNVEHWVQDGNGKFKPVTKFEKGKVYVVEFWATWCGPCIASMPHLAHLQTEYADKGVQLISISDEELETVKRFLERPVQGSSRSETSGKEGSDAKESSDKEAGEKAASPAKESKPETYQELTSVYCLTTDPDRSSHADYMDAAGQNGIPTAFIVGKDQKIEWIGHPSQIDEPLSEVVQGTWDREKFGESFRERQEQELLIKKISLAVRAGDTKAALAAVEDALGKAKSEQLKQNLALYRLQIQFSDKDSQDRLPQIVSEAYKTYADRVEIINSIAWNVVQRMERGGLKSQELLEATRAAVEKAASGAKGDVRAAMLDTAAHAHALAGDLSQAIETQTKAIEAATPPMKTQLKEYLDRLEQEKAKADEDKSSKQDKSSQ